MMKITWSITFIVLLFAAWLPQSFAIQGACGDRPLPSDKTRKLHHNSIRLECSSEVDHFIRTPEPFGQNLSNEDHAAVVREWMFLEEEKQLDKMQKWRQSHEKIPQWKGSIPYQTVEKWTWEEYVYGYDSSCPTYTKTRTVTRTDKDGRSYQDEEVYTEQPPCWHDEDRHESRFCSLETMTFDAEFIRPSLDPNQPAKDSKGQNYTNYWWNPSHTDYHSIIPNRYDLLPGEMEDIQLYSNTRMSTSIRPDVAIGDAWNKYDKRFNIVGHGASASCEMRKHYGKPDLHLQVRILAIKRDSGKTTPNALRANGVDEDGNELPPLRFNESLNRKGKLNRTIPWMLRLTDSSSFIIEAMARQSRSDTADREIKKAEKGEGSNTNQTGRDKVDKQANASGFYKDTRIRVRLLEVTHFASRNIQLDKLYRKSGAIAQRSMYEIKLDDVNDSLFKIGPFEHHLKADRSYQMQIAMYNHDVPFYRQEYSGINALEGWFSKELPIPFKTDPDMKDKRGFIEKHFVDHANASFAEKWANIWDLITFKWLRGSK